MNNLSIAISKHDSRQEITLVGNLTLMDALEFKSILKEEKFISQEIILNLQQVKEVDLTGLNALLMGKIKLEKEGKKMSLKIDKDHPLHSLLHLTKFANQFNMVSS